MAKWTLFPHTDSYRFDAASVKNQWERLHAGDAEPCPGATDLLQAWALLHSGAFEQAAAWGLRMGGVGITVANKATAIYANYLEPREAMRIDLFMQVAERALAQASNDPGNANAWYWHAYALVRYGQGISLAKALAQGLGTRVKESLEKALALSPGHADARIALGSFHAEVIDKMGPLVGGMTHGAKKDTSLQLLQEALALNPGSVPGMMEYANALVMLEGEEKMQLATQLYKQAASCAPRDAMEHLDVEMARAELEN